MKNKYEVQVTLDKHYYPMLHHGGVMSWAQMDEKDNLGSLIDQTLTRIPIILENRSMRSFCSGAGTCWDCVKDKGRPPFMGNYSLSFKMCLENCTHHYCFSTIPIHPFLVSRPPMPLIPFQSHDLFFFIIINNNCYYLPEWVNARPHPYWGAVGSEQQPGKGKSFFIEDVPTTRSPMLWCTARCPWTNSVRDVKVGQA